MGAPDGRQEAGGLGQSRCCLRKCLHHCEDLVSPIPLRAGEVKELFHSTDNGSSLWRTGDHDGSSPPKVQKFLVAKDAEGSQHGIGVDAEHGGEILRLRNAISRIGLAFCDSPPDFGRHLIV
jgi:hypothetical protein